MFLASNRETEHDQFSIGMAGEGSSFMFVCVLTQIYTGHSRSKHVRCINTMWKMHFFQTGWPEISQDCSEFASSFFFFFFLYFFPEEDESRVWSDMRRWTSFPPRRLSSSISPPPPLSWSFNSGCVSRLSGMNIVSVPQNQPYWIMSRALCEMPSG